jgi:hypothetical protein
MAFSLGIWVLVSMIKPEKPLLPFYSMEIKEYVEGNNLFLNKLENYKAGLENQIPEIVQNGGGLLVYFGGSKKQTDSTEYKEWRKILFSVDSAITLRKLINDRDFVELKKTSYSENQNEFKLAVEKIDSTDYERFKTKLVNVENLKLTTITDKINKILDPKNKPNEENNENHSTTITQKVNNSSNNSSKTPQQDPAALKGTDPISADLKSSSITIEQLNGYKEKFPQNKSIQLYLEFWSKITSNQKNDFDDLLNRVKIDGTLKNSALKNFLLEICKNSDEFQKFTIISGRATCKTLDVLKSKKK